MPTAHGSYHDRSESVGSVDRIAENVMAWWTVRRKVKGKRRQSGLVQECLVLILYSTGDGNERRGISASLMPPSDISRGTHVAVLRHAKAIPVILINFFASIIRN